MLKPRIHPCGLLMLSLLSVLSAVRCAEAPKSTEPPAAIPPAAEDPCADPLLAETASCQAPIRPYQGTHPIDRVLYPLYVREHIAVKPAGEAELCRRLMGDLLGRLPAKDEIARECAGRGVEQIARNFQKRDEYLLLSERHWRDRFDTDDVVVDWRYLKELYTFVDALHRGELKYDAFAEKVLAHPGFVMTTFLPEDMAKHAFRAFLGREATDAEAADLAALFRPWIPAQEPDPDFPYVYTLRTYLLPVLCSPLTRCRASLFGGAEVSLLGTGTLFGDYIRWEDLDAIDRDALGEVGRLFARQPFFWEAAADEILERLLGWSDGGRFPRQAGVLLPEVRQVLADYLRNTGDYPGAERLVLTSWLYRQTGHTEPDGLGDDPAASSRPVSGSRLGKAEPPEDASQSRPVYAYGPVKPAPAETWLDSIAPMTFLSIGTCDPRYPDYYAYSQMYNAEMTGTITTEQLAHDLAQLYMMQENRDYFGPGQRGFDEPYYYYTYYARLLGGCPGFQSKRQAPAGLAFGFQQETFAELVCATGVAQHTDPGTAPFAVKDVLAHQMRYLFGREPAPEETAGVLEAYRSCSGEDCTEAGIERSICTALAGSAEMLFY